MGMPVTSHHVWGRAYGHDILDYFTLGYQVILGYFTLNYLGYYKLS
jgi:hypothetical protein